MVPSDESNARDRSGKDQGDVEPVKATDPETVNTATAEPEYEHYSADDPFRSERIATLHSAVSDVLPGLSAEEVERIDLSAAKRIQSDAKERSRWPKAMAIQFTGALSLAKLRTPPIVTGKHH